MAPSKMTRQLLFVICLSKCPVTFQLTGKERKQKKSQHYAVPNSTIRNSNTNLRELVIDQGYIFRVATQVSDM